MPIDTRHTRRYVEVSARTGKNIVIKREVLIVIEEMELSDISLHL